MAMAWPGRSRWASRETSLGSVRFGSKLEGSVDEEELIADEQSLRQDGPGLAGFGAPLGLDQVEGPEGLRCARLAEQGVTIEGRDELVGRGRGPTIEGAARQPVGTGQQERAVEEIELLQGRRGRVAPLAVAIGVGEVEDAEDVGDPSPADRAVDGPSAEVGAFEAPGRASHGRVERAG